MMNNELKEKIENIKALIKEAKDFSERIGEAKDFSFYYEDSWQSSEEDWNASTSCW